VDYLGLVLAAHEEQTLGKIAFRDLPATATDDTASAAAGTESTTEAER
jgi:hypothetical protein